MSVPIPLSVPLEAHGDTLTELTLREPTGKDIRTMGVPFRIGADDGSIIIDAAAVHRMIGALASLPPSAVDRLTPADWTAAMTAVLGFFGVAQTGS